MFSTLEIEHLLRQEVTGLTYLISILKKVSSLPNERFKILLKNRMNSLKILLNRVEADENTPVERKASLLEDIAVALSDLIFMEAFDPNDDLMWYEINALRLQIIAKLMNFWGKKGHLRMRGLGLALENILLGIKLPNIEPLLQPLENSKSVGRFFLALSLLNAKFQIFSRAIQVLHSIPWKDFVSWAKEALTAAGQLMDLLEEYWDLPKFYELGKNQDPDLPFTILTNYIAIPLNIISFLLTIHPMVAEKWPAKLVPNYFLEKGTTNELLASIGSILRFIEHKMEEIINSHVFQENDKPLKDPLMTFYIHHFWRYRLIHEGLATIHLMKRTNSKEKHLHRLGILVTKILELLRSREYLMHDPDYLKTTPGEQLVETLWWFITIISYHDWNAGTTKNLKKMELIAGSYLNAIGFERFPLLGALFHQAMLAIASKTRNTALMLRSSKKLLQLLDFLDFFPRDRLSSAFLGHITLRLLNLEDDNQLMKFLNDEILNAYKNGISTKLMTMVLCYVEKLNNSLTHQENPSYDDCRVLKKKMFDPKSHFLPNFSFLIKHAKSGSISYLPLNLEIDRIE